MADLSTKNIEDVQIGDMVLSYDSELKQNVAGEVRELEHPIREGVYVLNNGLITVTNEHPFYTRGTDSKVSVEGWASIAPEVTREETQIERLFTLQLGDMVRREQGDWVVITSIEYKEGSIQTYNLKQISGSETFYANAILVHNKGGGCVCGCTCDDLTPLSGIPTLSSPANGASGADLELSVLLDWLDIAEDTWGVDGRYCTNDVNSCACEAIEDNSDGVYELYLSTTDPGIAPPVGKSDPCPGGADYACSIFGSQYKVQGGSIQYPLLDGTTYYWAVRAVNPGPLSTPGGNGVSCTTRGDWSEVWSFTTGFLPDIVNIQVETAELPCALPAEPHSVSRWTGRLGHDSTNNPLSISMTVSDGDGYADVSDVFFYIAPDSEEYKMPFNCHSDFIGTTALQFQTAPYLDNPEFWSNYIITYAPEETCTPGCNYTNKSECNAAHGGVGCVWSDYEALFWGPENSGCGGCVRDWNAFPFNTADPLYYHNPNCTWPILPCPEGPGLCGHSQIYTGCSSCYFGADKNPMYQITNVTHEIHDSTTITYAFTIEFNDSFASDFLAASYLPGGSDGVLNFYGMVRNYVTSNVKVFQTTDAPGCDGTAPCRETDPAWTWGFDFADPTGDISMYHDPGDVENELTFSMVASDDLGLRSIYNSQIEIEPDHAEDPILLLNMNWTNPDNGAYTNQTTENSVGGFVGGDQFTVTSAVEDMACNIVTPSYGATAGDEWILSLNGDVFGADGLEDPLPDFDPFDAPFSFYDDEHAITLPNSYLELSLGTFWVGEGGVSNDCFSLGYGLPSNAGWCSSGYTDGNAPGGGGEDETWSERLYRLAYESEEITPVNITSELALHTALQADGSSFIIYQGDSPVQIGNDDDDDPFICGQNKTEVDPIQKLVFFMPSSSYTVNIYPDIIEYDDVSCVFIGNEFVDFVIKGGANKADLSAGAPAAYASYDIIEGYFITGGTINVEEDTADSTIWDPLVVYGSLFGGTELKLQRHLQFSNNLVQPSELVIFDPGFWDTLRGVFGRSTYSDIECGLVQGNGLCSNWCDEEQCI